jgi:hypothetical protein
MWGGHSCPPPLNLPLHLSFFVAATVREFLTTTTKKIKAAHNGVRPTHHLG